MGATMPKDNAVTRVLRILELLSGRFFEGISGKELADILHTTPATACRDMQQLESLGWARKLENGRWGLTPKPLHVMQSYTEHYNALHSRMAETQQNILAGARRHME